MCCFLCYIQNWVSRNWKTILQLVGTLKQCGGYYICSSNQFENYDSENVLPRKHHRSAHFADMESPLFTWFTKVRAQNIPISEEILKTKVRQFGEQMGITAFSYSNDWLTSFNLRHGISVESANVDLQLI